MNKKGILYREIEVKTALYRHEMIDTAFPVRYSVNPYSGCEYGCRYCRVNWKAPATKTVITKKNFSSILERELRTLNHRQLIGVGGGYNDIFAPINREKRLSERTIERILREGHRPLLITKNPAYVLEIMKGWSSLPKRQRPIVITSLSGPMGKSRELDAPSPAARLAAIKTLASDLVVGVAFLPWMGKLFTEEGGLSDLIKEGKKSGWGFTLLGFLEGKPPLLNSEEEGTEQKRMEMQKSYLIQSRETSLFPRLPPAEFFGYLTPQDEITVWLGYHYYLGDEQGKKSFRLASYQINRLSESEFEKLFLADQLEKINGVGPVISTIISDFLRYKKTEYFISRWKNWGID